MTGSSTSTLRRQLAGWFLAIGLLPLIIVALISYLQTRASLQQAAETGLSHTAVEKLRFINNWFDYRWMDLNLHAGSAENITLLETLTSALRSTELTAEQFIQSDEWAVIVKTNQAKLSEIQANYDYISDLFLIDRTGNILFSTAQQSDLGANLFSEPLRHSRFSNAVSQALSLKRAVFSDYERYAPSQDLLCGFLVAPMTDNKGNLIGAFAIQIRLDRLNQLLRHEQQDQVYHYLVGSDGLLRSSLTNKESEVLNRRITTPTFVQWQRAGTTADKAMQSSTNGIKTFQYIGPLQQAVLGQYNVLFIGNVNWILISEINQAAAYSTSNWLAKFDALLLVISTLIIGFAITYVSRRLSLPIVQLSKSVEAFSRNEQSAPVQIDTRNEFKTLAENFNKMMASRERYEGRLKVSEAAIQAALNELNEQLSALSHHAIVATTDVKGTILYVNKKFEEVSGYQSEELVGKNHRLLNSGYHPQSFFRDMYKTISSGKIWHAEICNRAKDEHLYWVTTTIASLRDHNGKIDRYIAIRTDITQQKAVQQELRDARDAAEAAAKAKSEFLATMSHEIRTPMNGVLGMLGLLMRSKLNPEQRHQTRLAMDSADSLLMIINDILDFSKIEAGRLDIELFDFDLNAMLGDFVESIAPKAHEKGLELILDVVGIEHSMVKGDPGRIRQIISNLVSNAIKFTKQGEIIIRAALITTDDYGYRFECSVTDTGIGIPQHRSTHIFESFTQVDASTTRHFGGTGLGLAIVKQLCQLMHGDIQLTSEVGKGSCFVFNVLLEPSSLSRAAVPTVIIENVPLLVVDDNDTNREVLRRQLKLWGARVELASDAQQALRMMEKKLENGDEPHYAVAFLDMLMPDMNGEELGQAIRSDPNLDSTKLIMMSSIGNRGDANRLTEIGFDGYFPKPTTLSDLFNALAVLLEDGEALAKAAPLVTHHYLKSLDNDTSQPASDWPDNCRLLMVEDNNINQTVIQGMLDEFGLHCETASQGQEALEMMQISEQNYPYHLILMDCQMPVLDGYSTCQCIRQGQAGERYRRVPIVAMTANAMKGDREKCLEAGMNDYLSKPINIDDLHAKLQTWLNNKTPAQPPTQQQATDLIWDERDALKRVRNKPQRLHTLICMFMSSSTTLLAELRQHLVDGNIEAGIHSVHTLKGVAANLSANCLTRAAENLEIKLREGECDSLMPMIENIIQQQQKVQAVFSDYLDKYDQQHNTAQ